MDISCIDPPLLTRRALGPRLRKLRRLVLRDGVSIREASNRLGISRNTAKKWLDQPEMVEPRYPKRASGPGILGPFEEVLAQWLKSDSPPRPSW